MTIINDEVILNTAENAADWTVSGFSSPELNNTSSVTPIFREGTGCMWWPFKKGVTGGYAYDGITSTNFTGKLMIFWINYAGPDITGIPISSMKVQISSAAGYTTNYGRWDCLAQINNLDLYGWTPVAVYTTNPDEINGTPNYATILSYGLTVTTGNTADGKQGGFDQILLISYIGGHSQTVTLTDIYTHSVANDHGVAMKFGSFIKLWVNIRLGGGTTINTVFNEAGRTIFFDNVEPEHNLGFIFVDNTTGQNQFTLSSSDVSWNQQTGTTPQVFTGAEYCDIFRVNSCSFYNGGAITLRSWASDADTYFTNCTIEGCDRIDPLDILFSGNSIINSRIIANNNGALLLDADSSARWSNLSFTRGSSSHAIVITAIGIYTFTNFIYSGYSANGTDTAVIRNESGGSVTINVVGGDTPTYQNGTGSTTTIQSSITLKFVVKNEAGTVMSGVSVYIDDQDVEPYILNTTTDINGEASTEYVGSPVTNAGWRARKYGYKPFSQLVDIGSENITLPITMVVDPIVT